MRHFVSACLLAALFASTFASAQSPSAPTASTSGEVKLLGALAKGSGCENDPYFEVSRQLRGMSQSRDTGTWASACIIDKNIWRYWCSNGVVLETANSGAALAACTAAPSSVIANQKPAAQSFNDPVEYCKAVKTVDRPGKRYEGPAITEQMAALFGKKVADDPALEWRCYNGAVLACITLNTPVCGKIGKSVATAGIRDFCAQNPDATSIPAAIAGRDVEWSCKASSPVSRKQVAVDARGFRTDAWKQLSVESPVTATSSPQAAPTVTQDHQISFTPLSSDNNPNVVTVFGPKVSYITHLQFKAKSLDLGGKLWCQQDALQPIHFSKTPVNNNNVMVLEVEKKAILEGMLLEPNQTSMRSFLDALRSNSTNQCEQLRQAGRLRETSKGYMGGPLPAVPALFAVWAGYNGLYDATFAAYSLGPKEPWIFVANTPKYEEEQRLQREAAARREEAERQRLALEKQKSIDAKRAVRESFSKEYGISGIVGSNTFATNPFVYKNKVVSLLLTFVRMIGENEAVFKSGDNLFLLDKVPSTRYTGERHVYVAVRSLGTEPTTALGAPITLPSAEFVGALDCTDASCSNLFESH